RARGARDCARTELLRHGTGTPPRPARAPLRGPGGLSGPRRRLDPLAALHRVERPATGEVDRPDAAPALEDAELDPTVEPVEDGPFVVGRDGDGQAEPALMEVQRRHREARRGQAVELDRWERV